MSSTASDQVPKSPIASEPEKRISTATATFVGDVVQASEKRTSVASATFVGDQVQVSDLEKRISEATGFARCADGRLGRDISAPFNFKHESHVGAQFIGFPGSWRYTGLPASWAAALATQPPSAPSAESPSSSHHHRFLLKLPSPILALKNMSPSQRWNRVWTACTIKFHPHPVADENISLPFNFKHEVHAESKYTPSWHAALILSAEDSWRSTLTLSQRQRSNQLPKKRFPSFSFNKHRQQPATPIAFVVDHDDDDDDEDISLPWNFQHNVHVDEKFNGLPPSWRATLENQGFPFPIPEPCCPHVCVGNLFTNKI